MVKRTHSLPTEKVKGSRIFLDAHAITALLAMQYNRDQADTAVGIELKQSRQSNLSHLPGADCKMPRERAYAHLCMSTAAALRLLYSHR